MRQFLNVMRSRAVPILSGAVVAILVVPATALAGGFAAPHGGRHAAATGSGGTGGVLILLGLIAVVVLSAAILSRPGVDRKRAQRPTKSIRRKPAGIAS